MVRGIVSVANRNAVFLVSAYVFALVYLLARLHSDVARGGHKWKQGDWLVNNLSVRIRRGVLGSFLITASDYLQVSPLHIVAFIQGLLVTAIFLSLIVCCLRLHVSDRIMFTVLSPAFLFFWLYAPQAMRKEIIVYLAFSIILLGVAFTPEGMLFKIAALLVYGTAVFSHEASVFFLPFFIMLFYWFKKKD